MLWCQRVCGKTGQGDFWWGSGWRICHPSLEGKAEAEMGDSLQFTGRPAYPIFSGKTLSSRKRMKIPTLVSDPHHAHAYAHAHILMQENSILNIPVIERRLGWLEHYRL